MLQDKQTIRTNAQWLMTGAARFFNEEGYKSEKADLKSEYVFHSDGRGQDIAVDYQVSIARVARGTLHVYVGWGSGPYIAVKAALILAMISMSRSLRVRGQTYFLSELHDISVEFTDGHDRKRVSLPHGPLPVLQFFITKIRAAQQYASAVRWDRQFYDASDKFQRLHQHICTEFAK